MANWDETTESKPGGQSAFLGSLAYALPVAGAFALLVWRRRDGFARFHALQSLALTLAASAAGATLTLLATLPWVGFLYLYLGRIFQLLVFLCWIWLVCRAALGRRDRAPVVGGVIERYLYPSGTTKP